MTTHLWIAFWSRGTGTMSTARWTDQRRWNPDLPPLPACARGVGTIERTYHPDRLQYPMGRTGLRGSGQFARISWDEALDTVAKEMLRVRATYGNAAILDGSRTGSQTSLRPDTVRVSAFHPSSLSFTHNRRQVAKDPDSAACGFRVFSASTARPCPGG
jgi:hypothetical protein